MKSKEQTPYVDLLEMYCTAFLRCLSVFTVSLLASKGSHLYFFKEDLSCSSAGFGCRTEDK